MTNISKRRLGNKESQHNSVKSMARSADCLASYGEPHPFSQPQNQACNFPAELFGPPLPLVLFPMEPIKLR